MSFWQNRNVFVTGASGLLGSWTVQELVAPVALRRRGWQPGQPSPTTCEQKAAPAKEVRVGHEFHAGQWV